LILLDVWQYNIADLLYDYPRIDSISDYGIHDDFNIASISTGDSLDNFIDSLRMDDRVALANYIYLARPDNPIYIGFMTFQLNTKGTIVPINFYLVLMTMPHYQPLRLPIFIISLMKQSFATQTFRAVLNSMITIFMIITGRSNGRCIVFLNYLLHLSGTKLLKLTR